ncbi:MAG: DUF134 domain-containing protein [Bacteroidetes bacterium]|nr:DUF134 domain-containing protein [Bacteroidota bacterium]MBL6963160.1 DUF134 domain-containing protein [Bacteroidota bacterium]
MPRPKRNRFIARPPAMEGFKPFGIPIRDLEPVILLYEEYETIRLSDYEGMEQEQAAKKMKISRPTFTRIYRQARSTIAQAFVEGKAIFIEGGNYHTDDFWYRCDQCMKLNISSKESGTCEYCYSKTLRKLNINEESHEKQ